MDGGMEGGRGGVGRSRVWKVEGRERVKVGWRGGRDSVRERDSESERDSERERERERERR